MTMKPKPKQHTDFLNRYTSLPIFVDIIDKQAITLLSPKTWEDRNDSFYLEEYQNRKALKTLLALCFSTKSETFHHWKIFAGESAGVCIQFDKDKLLGGLRESDGFRSRAVDYKLIREVKSPAPKIEDWPFLKRKPFKDEGEFRITYERHDVCEKTKQVPIKTDFILSVTLCPWLPESVANSVKKMIKSLPGCNRLRVSRSTLLETANWKAAIMQPKI